MVLQIYGNAAALFTVLVKILVVCKTLGNLIMSCHGCQCQQCLVNLGVRIMVTTTFK